MRRLAWTCAAGVWTLLCACDTNRGDGEGDVAERAAIEAIEAEAIEAIEAVEPIEIEEEECERGCGGHPDHAAPARDVAKPLAPELVKALAREDRPVQGRRDAKLEVMVWNDFECPFCRKEVEVLEELLAAYPDVKLVFKQFPLPMHDAANAAARASLAAERQGKFWPMHDALFEQPARVKAREFSAIAGELGLDVDRFERDLEDPEIVAAVERDIADARDLGIRGTPSIVVGNALVVGAHPLETLREVVDAELRRAG